MIFHAVIISKFLVDHAVPFTETPFRHFVCVGKPFIAQTADQ